MNLSNKGAASLVFPVFLFLLIFLIIILSTYSDSFAKLLSNRNPVTAFSTLLILSYSKLLQLIIAALQFTFLTCHDDSYTIVWMYDANIQYFSPSPQFIVASLILTACMLFTTLLFFGQWFPRCSNWKVMKWTKNTKYIGFIDSFHAPFTPKHCYWVGLILFAVMARNFATSMAPDSSVRRINCFQITNETTNRIVSASENLNVDVFCLGTLSIKNTNEQCILANGYGFCPVCGNSLLPLLQVCCTENWCLQEPCKTFEHGKI